MQKLYGFMWIFDRLRVWFGYWLFHVGASTSVVIQHATDGLANQMARSYIVQ
jgi:hypothetical protein